MGARRGEGVAEICGISEETTAGFIAYTGLASSKFLHLPLHSLAAYRCFTGLTSASGRLIHVCYDTA